MTRGAEGRGLLTVSWWALAVVSDATSIQDAVSGLRRDDLLEDPHRADAVALAAHDAWWRVTGVVAPAS